VFTPRVATGQLRLSGTATASLFVHLVDIGNGVEESTGLVVGAEGAASWPSRLAVAVRAAGGALSTDATGAEDRKVGELGAQASFGPAKWLVLFGGARSRVYSTAVARQRWNTVELGAQAHADFATMPVRAVLQGGIFPVVSGHGLPKPDVAFTGAAGLEYRRGSVTGAVFYELERYDFPDSGSGRRLEQVNQLTLRFSVRLRPGEAR